MSPSTQTAAPKRKSATAKPMKAAAKPVEPATAMTPATPAARPASTPVEPVAGVVALTPPPRSTRRRGRSARTVPPVALGSLTQPGARNGETCDICGTSRITTLALLLTDGTPVRFTSCHACEHRSWVGPDGPLDRATVLERTRKLR